MEKTVHLSGFMKLKIWKYNSTVCFKWTESIVKSMQQIMKYHNRKKKCIPSFGWETIWQERIWEFQQCLGKYGDRQRDCEEMARVHGKMLR
jgi:hypothetical protein